MGVIGLGGRGLDVMRAFMAQPDVQVVAVCDVIGARRLAGQEQVNRAYGNQDCAAYIDFLELLARPDIDAVLIATGDNWHSGLSILAARAGKDIYCEKPMSVTIAESRAVSDTMRRLGRIYQCGTQRRSISHFRFAVQLARSGKLGRLTEVHAEEAGGLQQGYDTILPAEPEPPREEMDWNRWLGPAPWRPYNSKTPTRAFWSAHWDFSGASITEWGSHTVDLCQWANNMDDTGPVEFWREGARFIGRYANGSKLVIRTGLRFGTCPVRFEGEEGWVETGDSGEMEAHPKSLLEDRRFLGGYPPDNHARAFLDCVKTRQQTVSNAEVAHRSISACHVANLCKRLGRPIKWDPKKEECIGDEEANRLRSRAYREPWYL
jgi:predicted dehydrogenase